jgi:hypothetical protein
MNRLATLAMTALSLLFVAIALRAGSGIGYAEQDPTVITSMPPLMPSMPRCRI